MPRTLLALAAMLAAASLLAVVSRPLRVPLSLVLVAVGFVAGELGAPIDIEGKEFSELVIFALVPILVFESALGLPARAFMRNLVPILALATWALIISGAIVGLAVHAGLGVSLAAALMFGALISATDPAAVTSVFRELGVPRRLLVLVEGESLLNDGIAIVLFEILLVAALGTGTVTIGSGVLDFLWVFLGGLALGGMLGLIVAQVAARLGTLPSTALTIAVAYGGFVLGNEVFGFSGVTTAVAAGLVLSALSHTLVPRAEAETWHKVWEALAFVANGILFLLIGVALDAGLIAEYWGSILLAVAAVTIARPLAVFGIVPALARLVRIPTVGVRNELIISWAGLRGGVALALALSLPETLPQRDRIVAMTAGVVIATLAVNATTIGWLIRRLRLDKPTRMTRFITAAARYAGARAALRELHADLRSPAVERQLAQAEQAALSDIGRLGLEPDEQYRALLSRGLAVERTTLHGLIDDGLVSPWRTRVVLNLIEDQIDELSMGHVGDRPRVDPHDTHRLRHRVSRLIHLGRLEPAASVEIAYRTHHACRAAAHDAVVALEEFRGLPAVDGGVLDRAVAYCRALEARSLEDGRELAADAPAELIDEARRRYAADLARRSSYRALEHLAEVGAISRASVDTARTRISDALHTPPG